MKIDFKKYLSSRKLFEHAIMESLGGLPEETQQAYFKTIQGEGKRDSEWARTGLMDIQLIVNGIEFNPERFFNMMEEAMVEDDRKFEKFKNLFRSKNSPNARLYALQQQAQKASLILQNIQRTLEETDLLKKL